MKLMPLFTMAFWYAMDTARDNIYLNSLWEKNKAQWKIWKN